MNVPPASAAGRRVGLLGGTFDPPHYGHLLLAQEAAWQLRLDQVLFLPARENPFKRGQPISAPEHRLAMLDLALQGAPACFALSRVDLDRPPPSYTADLLRTLRGALGADCALFFLSGADVLHAFAGWREPAAVLAEATLVVASRPGTPTPDLARFEATYPAARGRVAAIDMPGVNVSASEIRRRVRAGLPIRYLAPPAVDAYIREQALYVNEQGRDPQGMP